MKNKYLVVVKESSGNIQQHRFFESSTDIKSFFDSSKGIDDYVGYQVYQLMFTNECNSKINAHETYVLKMSWGQKTELIDIHICQN